jgi:putative transposase
MPRATAHPVGVSPRQRRVLERLVRRRRTPQQLATRARIILAAAVGESNRALAGRLGITRDTTQAWRARWRAAGEALVAAEAGDDQALEAAVWGVLADAPRSGAPPTFTPEQLCQIVAVACESPPDSERPTSHWTPREVVDEVVKRGIVKHISVRTVGRFLASGGGRAQAPPEPLLAHPSPRRPSHVRHTGPGHL